MLGDYFISVPWWLDLLIAFVLAPFFIAAMLLWVVYEVVYAATEWAWERVRPTRREGP